MEFRGLTERHRNRARRGAARAWVLALTVTFGLAACASARESGATPPSAALSQDSLPKLVLLLSIDQLRSEYLDRWDSQLTGGLGRLAREGAYFPVAHHDHAVTATAPGHATLGSGRFPGSTGIRSNQTGILDQSAPLLAGIGFGASPKSFVGTTIVDWMVSRDRRTRVFSTSYKDRSAILSVGQHRGHVFWYSGGGLFTTSTYYRSELPEWVKEFNRRGLPQQYAGRTWNLLLPESAYPEPDSVPAENRGQGFTFPHTAADQPGYAPILLAATPWVDELTLEFALAGFRALGLGRGPQTDFMAVGLSGTDLVGHAYGPDSREIHDQILRLDRKLGEFLDAVFATVGRDRVVIALSSDHGVAPLAGARARSHDGGPFAISYSQFLAPVRADLARHGIAPTAVTLDLGMVTLDRPALAAGGVEPDSLVRELAAFALRIPGIARANRPAELVRSDTVNDHIARRWLHTLGPRHAVDLVITVAPGSYWSATGEANHGSPHDYDTQVPLVFHGGRFTQRRITDVVRTVDLAPTLAHVLGLVPAERLDGVIIHSALR